MLGPWSGPGTAIPVLLASAVLIRLLVGLHSYSGAGVAPKYGDYEAQRHWMEITYHTPVRDWYRETADNNLEYWGLDYPPLTAYQSWLCGKAIHGLEPEAVALRTSRGYETASSKTYMRWSVVAFDLLVFFPAAYACMRVFGHRLPRTQQLWMLAAVVLQPAVVLIDHGHFQYNNISLGLAAGAAAAVAAGWEVLGSVLYCLCLNHKQMSLYFAPAFFAHLLGQCLQRRTSSAKVLAVLKLGIVVIATFAACWAPFLGSVESALRVLLRLTPVKRGLFEDYVANFWCATHTAIKWKQLFSQQVLVRICTAATLAAALPSVVQQMRRPSATGLLVGMANSALAFFLFSYQVHEKSILLALLPITLLAAEEPMLARWMPAMAAFSMFPLLERDGLTLAYLAMLMLWAAIAWPVQQLEPQDQGDGQQRRGASEGKANRGLVPNMGQSVLQDLAAVGTWGARCLPYVSLSLALVLHLAKAFVPQPKRYPFVYDAAFITLSFMHFAAVAVYLNWRQWHLPLSQQASSARDKSE